MPLHKAALGPAAQPPVLSYRSAVGGSSVSDVFHREAVQNLAGPPNNWIKFFVVFLTDHALSLQQQPILAAATSVALPTKLNVKCLCANLQSIEGGGVGVYLHSFLASARDGVVSFTLRPLKPRNRGSMHTE